MANPTINERIPIPDKITVVFTPKLAKAKNNQTNTAAYLITEIKMVNNPLVFFKSGKQRGSKILTT